LKSDKEHTFKQLQEYSYNRSMSMILISNILTLFEHNRYVIEVICQGIDSD